jgi:hypothetical protein
MMVTTTETESLNAEILAYIREKGAVEPYDVYRKFKIMGEKSTRFALFQLADQKHIVLNGERKIIALAETPSA